MMLSSARHRLQTGNAMNARRVVTGHSAESFAVFASDDVVEPDVVAGLGFQFLKLWGADSLPSFPDAGSAQAYRDYFPPAGGFRFGIFTLPPEREVPLEPAERKNVYVQMEQKFPGLAAHIEARNPGMHTSDSIDFGYVISGSIWLELDNGATRELHAGDTYVQNGTRHAWRNRSSEPASILVVLVGTRREPTGLSVAQSQR
ncbi:cupin domain-containing protein [Variovorax sp. J22R133]|uniref:cupin domain-containing protein n=1 Tax=Variovorax brevis TaxID=3053503 RepID=UPI002576A8EC|nr:cupin domain-containing protein [Variovorax sp. J22R133]MDM0116460.1 cupin domain-containing protein [Variovorax sp. J22R133]